MFARRLDIRAVEELLQQRREVLEFAAGEGIFGDDARAFVGDFSEGEGGVGAADVGGEYELRT